MDRYKVYNIITKKTNNKFTEEQELEFAVDEIEQAIKNYCQIPKVPNALNFTVANMTIDLLNYYEQVNRNPEDMGIEDLDISDVSRVQIGDTTISVGEGRSASERKKLLNSHIADMDDIVMNYREQLNRFRRLW